MPFSPRRVLEALGFLPLDSSFRLRKSGMHLKILPDELASVDFGVYFRVVPLELELSRFMPSHRHKTTLSFLTTIAEQGVSDSDNKVKRYPQAVFFVVANRDLFSPRDPCEDEGEWLTSLTARTRGMAHELLIAQQWAACLTPESVGDPNSIAIIHPSPEEEDSLLCPSDLIEKYLRAMEKKHSVKLETVSEFLEMQGSIAQEDYFRQWLFERVVERDLVARKTEEYLLSDFRRRFKVEYFELLVKSRFGKIVIESDSFWKRFQELHDERARFFENCRTSFPSVDRYGIHFALKEIFEERSRNARA